MIGRAALKAMHSPHVQQMSVDYERQIQVLQAALEARRPKAMTVTRIAAPTPTIRDC